MRRSKNFRRIACCVIALATLVGCDRKELYYPPSSQLRLITHWPKGITEKPHYNEAIFYPTNGNKELHFFLESDTQVISLPAGEYNVIVYNWRTNQSAQTVQFRDQNSYVDMTSFTGKLINRSGYFDPFHLFLSPDMLYSWTTEEHESKVVTYATKAENVPTLHTYPKRVAHDYNFHVEVVGLEYVRAVSAVALGFAPRLTMYNKQGAAEDTGHKLQIEVTKQGFQCHFSAYNHHQPNDQRLYFVIKLPDGTVQEEYRDLNKELDIKGDIHYVEKIIIDFEGPVDPPPGGAGGFDPPEIGDWEGVEEDVVFPS